MIGKTLNHFKILDRLGKGGMGDVYLAEDSKLKRRVALKVLPEEVAQDPARLDRFQREAESVAALNHPNIVTIYSIEEAEGIHFLTMEFVEGETLIQLIPSNGMDVESFVRFSAPVAEALSAAHEKGIIHRDLKPGNIMVNRDARIKILDFGLAKLIRDDSDPHSSRMETRAETQDGIVLGTMPYMSPEQIQGKKLDHRSDIFSLGIIFYEMLTGRRPFHGETSAELISSIMRDAPLPVGDLKAATPEHLERIIRRCLQKDPKDRYQTARDVYNELKDSRTTTGPVSRSRSAVSVSAASEMWIAVLPFENPGMDAEVEALSDSLTEEVVLGLSRFSYLHVIARHSTSIYKGKHLDVRTVGQEIGARYILEGTIRKLSSSVRFNVQLIDTATGTNLWNEVYKKNASATDLFEFQEEIASKIISTVADTSGALIRSMASVIRTRPAEELNPYEAVIRGHAYLQILTSAEHREVRACLQKAVEVGPDYPDAWAGLARIYTEEYKHGFNLQPNPLDRALAAARKAIELDTASQQGYGALAEVSFFRKDFGTFRTSAERAIRLNPLNGDMVAFMGILTAYSGDWDRGVRIAENAMAFNPNHPGWYRFAAFFQSYRSGNYEQALEIAERINMPSYLYSHVALAAVYAHLGRMDAARNSIKDLLSRVPNFGQTMRAEMGGKWLVTDPALIEQLVQDLHKAGLEIPDADDVDLPAVATMPDPQPKTADSDAWRAQSHGMWIAVLPFQRPADDEMQAFADGLSEDITAALSQFSYLSVISRDSTERGARYVIQGGIRKSGTLIRVNVQLIDSQTGANLWAETFNRDLNNSDIFTIQDEITDRVAATLADNFGVLVRSMVANLEDKPDEQLSANEFVFRFFGYWMKLTPEEHAKIRASLEGAVERIPKNADIWGCLSVVYYHEFAFGFNELPNSLDRTLAAAQHAVELNRASQLAYEALTWAQFFRRDVAALPATVERAISLNPRNSHMLAVAGLVLVHTRNFERGAAIARRAMELNPHHAGWFHFSVIWDHYSRDEYVQALEQAKRVNMPGQFWPQLVIASICGELGRKTEAASAVNELLAIDPEFAIHARRYIEPWHYGSGLMDQLLEGLRKAGLQIPETTGS